MIAEQLLEEIDRGRLGLNHGISMGLPKLESIIDGVTRETYTLILSNSGAGKTSFALYAYVYKPLMNHLDDDDFKIIITKKTWEPSKYETSINCNAADAVINSW